MAKADSSNKKDKEMKRRFRLNKLYTIIAVLVLLLIGGGFYGYNRYDNLKKENQKLSDPQEAAKAESDRIRKEVSGLIDVPTDEEPTIATVVDPTKLGNQAFFAKAQKDDRVVIYAKAKKAILYRPSTKKIVEVAPLNIGDTKATPATPTTDPATVPVTPDQ